MISSTLQTQENKNITTLNNERERLGKMATVVKLNRKSKTDWDWDWDWERKEKGGDSREQVSAMPCALCCNLIYYFSSS